MADETTNHPSAHHLHAVDGGGRGPAEIGPYSATWPVDADLPFDVVSYGPDLPDESELRLLGNLEGRRVLDLGCGAGHAAIAMAKQGAKVIAVDADAANVARTRENAEAAEIKLEVHHADLAEIPFVRADGVEAVVSAYGLAGVADLDRVFRQVHRVLRPEHVLVFSLPHPAFAMFDAGGGDPRTARRAYHATAPREWRVGPRSGEEHAHPIGRTFTSLLRANFRVDTLLEPEVAAAPNHTPYWNELVAWVPSTVVFRARPEGI